MKEEKFPNSRTHSRRWVCGEFWNLRGQHNLEDKQKKQKNPQNMRLTITPSREAAQTLIFTASECRLNRESQAACLG